ncbi:MAG: murein biosynthesis integral membrane protein MurJ [Proteobacteria bacterium]|nr:murein biosynthesis integral membrane protein MurJ [Pseudomonadota bacterium]
MALLRSITTVGGYTMISRVLGFARDILIANILGASAVADAFFVAFKYPNFFRRLFAEGAFNAAFVPLFSGLLATGGRSEAKAFAEGTFAVLSCALLFLVAAFEIAMPWAMYAIAPGFAADPEKFQLAVTLTRITFPYLLFISLVSLMGGVLNSLDRFAAAAATPIILNVSLITALIGLARFTDTPGHALAWGVAAAGIAQFLWLYLVLHGAGMGLKLRRPRLTPKVRRLLKLMVPGAIGAGVVQINLLVDVLIASFLPSGSISYLYFADRVNQLPLGVIGVGVGTALLPLLSRQIRSEEAAAALDSQNRALEIALLLTIPAAAALMVISGPVILVLFGRGAFAAPEVEAASMALAAYAAGLPAYVLIKVLTPGYFAREDTVTPVKIASICVVVNLVLNLVLMGPFAHVGIAVATAIAAWINAALLAGGLKRRGHLVIDDRLKSRLPRIALAAVVMTVCLVLGAMALAGPLAGAEVPRIGALVGLVAGGIVIYGACAQLSGAADLKELKTLMGRT